MAHKDDRDDFKQHAAAQTAALGRDEGAFRRSVETVLDLDRHDYTYLWEWGGAPIIQWPADIMATQEAIWRCRPDVIIETGVARGGSILFLASMVELLSICDPDGVEKRVIGVDVDIRAHNRETIEAHPLSRKVTLVEGSSTVDETFATVKALIPDGARVMAILDSDHAFSHVAAELRLYAPLVTPGCYLVAADTLLGHLAADEFPTKRSTVLSPGDEPLSAVQDFLKENKDFSADPALNAKLVLSSSPGGYLRRVAAAREQD
ncbi:MAG: CmcI family methyltransferase [Pseudomonadota bacterium]